MFVLVGSAASSESRALLASLSLSLSLPPAFVSPRARDQSGHHHSSYVFHGSIRSFPIRLSKNAPRRSLDPLVPLLFLVLPRISWSQPSNIFRNSWTNHAVVISGISSDKYRPDDASVSDDFRRFANNPSDPRKQRLFL